MRVARGNCQAQQVSGNPSYFVAPRAPDGTHRATPDDGPPFLSPCLVTQQAVWVTDLPM